MQGANMPTIVNFSSVQCSLCIRVVVESPSYCNIIYCPYGSVIFRFLTLGHQLLKEHGNTQSEQKKNSVYSFNQVIANTCYIHV